MLKILERFSVGVDLHQGSALSPYLFNVVMDMVTKNLREKVDVLDDALCRLHHIR